VTLVVPESSQVRMAQRILSIDLDLKLYVNSWSPDLFDDVTRYTELGGVGGYNLHPIKANLWSIVGGLPTQCYYPQVQWVFTASAGFIHGYFVTERSNGQLAWAEQFVGGPMSVTVSGDILNVTPKLDIMRLGG